MVYIGKWIRSDGCIKFFSHNDLKLICYCNDMPLLRSRRKPVQLSLVENPEDYLTEDQIDLLIDEVDNGPKENY